MTQSEIRPHIVTLLCDADFKYRPDTNTWSHRDGRPFTKEEQVTAFGATRAEVEEVKAQIDRYMQKAETPEALEHFLAPYMEQLTEKTLGNAVELMTEDDRAELDHLLGSILEPVRLFAPYTF
ncbi:hypothetical protein [Streptomyces chiangmaiensis]|uniref:Uncharacterized protein n=1 Tax=Streptomyces chiangmaiensis TaxID=766497 RepID=A0ABU7FI72_9ACTN|nr:hypothetical protein [Streptomyces chiangmaiensis]MED7823832.1 hypothetical protein [Streptomyces chiangmaiensis]